MIDETTGPGEQNAPEGQTEAGERVAFCQQCGKPLTTATVRRVGSAVYCEPCLVARVEGTAPPAGSTAGWTPVSGAVPPVGGPGQPVGAPTANEPSPWLAALLGLIPGVGAAYNGQYAKGLAHLVIFVVVDSLQKNVSDVFGLLVLGWIVYQAIDAYHTAKARRDGTPLPNAFGLNDIGDRMGFGRNWPGSASRPVTSSTTAGWASAAAPGAATVPPAGSASTTTASPNWAGYVPPTHFGATVTPPPPVQPTQYSAPPSGAGPATSTSSAPWTQTPYASPYTGEEWRGATGVPIAPMPPVRRFPVGAAWLIAVGLIFLIANLSSSWHLGATWLVAIVLAACGSWMLYRRVEIALGWARMAAETDPAAAGIAPRLVCQLRGPVMLLVLALLFALQAAGVRTIGQTWGVLLIALGALLILERMFVRSSWYPAGVPANSARPPAADPRKGGQ